MGYTYQTHIIIGYEVSPTWVYSTRTEEVKRCKHTNGPKAVYCSTCGAQTAPSVRTIKELNPEVVTLLWDLKKIKFCRDLKFDSLHEFQHFYGEVGLPLSPTVILREHRNNMGFSVATAGVTLAILDDDDRESHQRRDLPAIPTEQELRAVVDSYGIQVVEGSFGLHTLQMAF